MKNIIKTTLVLVLTLLFPLATFSQGTIGSSKLPLSGAILDLNNAPDDSGISTMGLMLPRVELVSTNEMLETGKDDPLLHVGLMVYNVSDCGLPSPIKHGAYTWDGEEWITAFSESKPTLSNGVFTFVDDRGSGDVNTYRARKFGNTIWMTESLRAKSYDPVRTDGTSPITAPLQGPIVSPAITENSDSIIHAWGYPLYENGQLPSNNTDHNARVGYPHFGYIYNQVAVRAGNMSATSGNHPLPLMQGICPAGWHVPTKKEFFDLKAEIAANAELYSSMQGPLTNDLDIAKAMIDPCYADGAENHGKSFTKESGGFAAFREGNVKAELVPVLPNATLRAYTLALSNTSTGSSTGSSTIIQVRPDLGFPERTYVDWHMVSVRCVKNDTVVP